MLDVLVQFVSACVMEVAGTKTLSFEGKELREHDVFGCNPWKTDLPDLIHCEQSVGVEEGIVWDVIATQIKQP